jgi:hypothetical protein
LRYLARLASVELGDVAAANLLGRASSFTHAMTIWMICRRHLPNRAQRAQAHLLGPTPRKVKRK